MAAHTVAGRVLALLAAALAALAVTAAASAHAHVSPPVALAGETQVFTLFAPTEKTDASTTPVELTPGPGFSIGSLIPTPGWKIDVQQSGEGENAVIQKVTWSGGSVPAGQAAAVQFTGRTDGSGTYSFDVRQTYSDGSVVDWSGPESSETPAPTIEAQSSLGGGGTSWAAWVAIALGALALVVGAVALAAGRGGRALA
jgi:uncharacterized protein YcnI